MNSILTRQHIWPSLAQDLAVVSLPDSPVTNLSQVYSTYGVTDAEVLEVLAVPAFKDLVRKNMEELRASGPTAGVKYKFSTLSQALAEKLFRDSISGDMEHRESIKLLELLQKAAGLLNPEPAAVVQNNIGIHLPLPRSLAATKLKHAIPVEASNV